MIAHLKKRLVESASLIGAFILALYLFNGVKLPDSQTLSLTIILCQLVGAMVIIRFLLNFTFKVTARLGNYRSQRSASAQAHLTDI